MMRQIFVTTSLLVAALVLPAGAAFADQTRADCTVGTAGEGGQAGDGQVPNGQASGAGSLTQTLDACNGVLTPPKVGDGAIVEPAPQTGTMPVITPKDMPPSGHSQPQP